MEPASRGRGAALAPTVGDMLAAVNSSAILATVVAIGVPTLAGVIHLVWRMGRVEQRARDQEARLDRMERKLDKSRKRRRWF